MDYEKMYKEALEKARKRVATEPQDHTDAILKDIFPELTESEDERIRRKMIDHFKAKTKETWCNMPVKDIIAYLEKQKEQKPVEWSEEDKEKIVTISEIIEHCTTIPYSGGTLTLNKEYKKELLCFIRTLRPSWKPSEDELTKKHLEGYIKGRNDALREKSDFMESHFNTQSGTSIKSGGNE